MHKTGTVSMCMIALAMLAVVIIAPGHAEEEELCIPMGILKLAPPEGVDQKRATVDFPHSIHFDYACQKCHHTWAGEPEIKNCTTTECHDQLTTPKGTDSDHPYSEAAIQYYKKAYHQLCIGCHKEIKEKNIRLELSRKPLDQPIILGGPTGCIQCHPKENPEGPEDPEI